MVSPWDEAYRAGAQYARMVREEHYPALSDTMLGFMVVDVFPGETIAERMVRKQAYRAGYRDALSTDADGCPPADVFTDAL